MGDAFTFWLLDSFFLKCFTCIVSIHFNRITKKENAHALQALKVTVLKVVKVRELSLSLHVEVMVSVM